MHIHMQGGEAKLLEFLDVDFDPWRIQADSQSIVWMVDSQNPYFPVFFGRRMHSIVHHDESFLFTNQLVIQHV